ncbi:MAG: hypothetical protein MRY32_09425 [Rickettsiales bacterium]|nr:hypothetical protein [Rickettsiales bacterium]
MQVAMEIRSGIIAFYREQFVQNVRTLIHVEKGLLVRAEALNQIEQLSRHLSEGIVIENGVIYREDVFDPAFCWWFEEHNENMLRMCERDVLVRAYEDLLDDKILNPNTGRADDVMTMAKARNNLRYFARHVLGVLLDEHSSLNDVETARRQLKSKVAQAKKPKTHPHVVDSRMMGMIFDEVLLRDPVLFKRYHAARQNGGSPLNNNGFLQLRSALKECDIPSIPPHQEELALLDQMEDASTSRSSRMNDEVRSAQEALINVLDGVTNRSMNYAAAAEEAHQIKENLQQSMQKLTNHYLHYKSLKHEDKKPAKIFDISSLFGRDKRENVTG